MPFENNSIDVFFLQNVFHHIPDINNFLREADRCLKKNGYFLIMEFGIPKRDLLKKPYKNFLKYVLPFTGSIVAHDRHSYKYLAESIISFPSQISLVNELKNIGFSHVKTIDFISGANSIYILQKK